LRFSAVLIASLLIAAMGPSRVVSAGTDQSSEPRHIRAVASAGELLAAQPGSPGPLATERVEYDLGDSVLQNPLIPGTNELRGVIHYPADTAAGPFPLVLILHGRHAVCVSAEVSWPCPTEEIPSYKGYDYLASHLASRGFVVVSVGANGVNFFDSAGDGGMSARANIIRKSLQLLQHWADGGSGSPMPPANLASVDFGRLGLIGHSRGGEGIMTYAEELATHPGDLVPSMLLPLAPVDFNRPFVSGIPVSLITPECDNDVIDIQGVHFFDDGRMEDSADRYWVSIDGANHNYFNTVWSPNAGYPFGADDFFDLDPTRSEGYCDPADGHRMTESDQQSALVSWATAIMEAGLKEFSASKRLMEGADPMPGMDPNTYVASWNPGSQRRFLINSHDGSARLSTGESGAEIAFSNGGTGVDCGNFASSSYHCSQGTPGTVIYSTLVESHFTPRYDSKISDYVSSRALGQSLLRWDVTGPIDRSAPPLVRASMPGGALDASEYDSVRWRIATVPSFANNFDIGQSGKIRITDIGDRSFDFNVNQSNPLYLRFPPSTDFEIEPGLRQPTTHMLVRQVRVPLASVESAGLNLAGIASIEFVVDRETKGEVTFSDLLLARETDAVPDPPPSTTSSSLTTTTTAPRTTASSTTTAVPAVTTAPTGPAPRIRKPVFTE